MRRSAPGGLLPRYPIYIPSKGRPGKKSYTARCLRADGVPFFLVIEEQEREAYREFAEHHLVLPFSNQGSVIPARNWIKEHARAGGHERHWQIDDNIVCFWRRWRGRRIRIDAGPALRITEDFVDRYENVAIAGLNYDMFAPDLEKTPPFVANTRVYSCTLFLNRLPYLWRGRYNEDADMCLQVLADGWCTILVNAFLAKKIWTMVVTGGNTSELYQGDGRTRMARSLERQWPGVVVTKRRFQRSQHVINWKKFDTPLKLKPGVDLDVLQEAGDPYGIQLVQVAEKIESPRLRKLLKDYQGR